MSAFAAFAPGNHHSSRSQEQPSTTPGSETRERRAAETLDRKASNSTHPSPTHGTAMPVLRVVKQGAAPSTGGCPYAPIWWGRGHLWRLAQRLRGAGLAEEDANRHRPGATAMAAWDVGRLGGGGDGTNPVDRVSKGQGQLWLDPGVREWHSGVITGTAGFFWFCFWFPLRVGHFPSPHNPSHASDNSSGASLACRLARSLSR